jgi:hydrogenase maturation protease
MKSKPDRILIIGYGNELRSDDAIGRHAARELARRGIAAIEVHQLTPELAERLSQVDLACFIDASASLAPGEIRLRTVQESGDGILDHYFAAGSLLRLCRDIYGRAPHAFLITAGGQSFGAGMGLSRAAFDAVQKIVTVCTAQVIREPVAL